jgi:hypothetical protein
MKINFTFFKQAEAIGKFFTGVDPHAYPNFKSEIAAHKILYELEKDELKEKAG